MTIAMRALPAAEHGKRVPGGATDSGAGGVPGSGDERRAGRPAVTAGALLLVLLLVPAVQGALFAGPAEIDAPGVYRLEEDVRGGIVIRSSDLLLDGMGHRLLGSREAGTVGLRVVGPASNVTVVNLTLQDWEVGVECREVAGGRLVGVNASNSTENGIFIDRCRDLEIRDGTAVHNGFPGIAINGSTACRVVNSTASANGDVGIYLLASRGCTVEACVAADNLLNGIYLEDVRAADVTGCRLCRNGYPGVAVNASRSVGIRCNLLSGNGLAGIWLEGSGPCVVTGNVAREDGSGLVVRNQTAPPWTGGNLWLTSQWVDGNVRSVPFLVFYRHPAGAIPGLPGTTAPC